MGEKIETLDGYVDVTVHGDPERVYVPIGDSITTTSPPRGKVEWAHKVGWHIVDELKAEQAAQLMKEAIEKGKGGESKELNKPDEPFKFTKGISKKED